MLWWRNRKYRRSSEEYWELLKHAYAGLAKNAGFVKALRDTGNELLIHSIGKKNLKETILTEKEFCGILMQIRKTLL